MASALRSDLRVSVSCVLQGRSRPGWEDLWHVLRGLADLGSDCSLSLSFLSCKMGTSNGTNPTPSGGLGVKEWAEHTMNTSALKVNK